ncbi:MAG: cupin domain-containing protein [Sedimentisphaerales bacterium]|nr:cupin domain-containing protein [Sedimentisphaerales bacterium]
MEVLCNTKILSWEDHPSVKNVSIKKMITREEFGEESPSIIMVKIPVHAEVPEHIHEGSEDILFILSGTGTMWIDEIGDVTLQKGVVVRVPRNTKHRIFDVSAELLIYDVFSPGIM